ncbi:hypothetical protein [Castellaniella sp.]|uniref:hypothetical protein n=1 Tax=Castellaniella sp. TaxID=1955812 RepID=UPI002AFEDDA0|nr:hypothetical protein [Castellaniella sp.]
MPIHAEERGSATYVGGGRYTCHDRSAECAIVKQNNRRIDEYEIRERQQRDRPYVNPDPTFSSGSDRWYQPSGSKQKKERSK